MKTLRLLPAWLRQVRGTVLLWTVVVASFVGLHLLGDGGLQEARYALILSVAAGLTAACFSLTRFARSMRSLQEADALLPEDEAALPSATTPVEGAWRTLALHLLRTEQQTLARTDTAARERTDYYTLWLHQIKTPLAALDLMAQSSAEVDRPLMRQELLKIEQYASSALDFQRLSSLHGDLELTEVLVYPLCCQVVRKLRPLFQYGQISITIAPFDFIALSDGKWLMVVLSQVLTNALKYTPAGGSIAVTMEDNVLCIRDTGIGIRAEDVPRVFDRGFTGSIGRTHDKSTGIGLYLCREVCRALGHTISLTSTLGEGTQVRIDLTRKAFQDM